jgi:probable rRNA maturation factor
MIQFINEDVAAPALEKLRVKRWINTVAGNYGKKCGDIAFVFCTDERILEVNKQYLQHDYYTDIITFDYSTQQLIAGDVLISLDTVRSNATQFNVTFEQELHRILIHGVLHLCGFDDKTPELRREMTERENQALTLF